MTDQSKKSPRPSVVTSAPASEVGSLLTDLLTEAKAEVAAERELLNQRLEDKQSAAQAVLATEEARKRELLQAKLVEETRSRNEALTRRERRQAETRAAAAKAGAAAPADLEVGPLGSTMPGQALPKPRSAWVWVAAAVLVLTSAGVTALLAANQPEGMAVPNSMAALTDNAIAQGKLELAEIRLDAKTQEAAAATLRLRLALKNAKSAEDKALAQENLRKAMEAEQKAVAARLAADRANEPAAATKGKRSKRGKRGKRGKTTTFRVDYFAK